jgi:hypothetical protein
VASLVRFGLLGVGHKRTGVPQQDSASELSTNSHEPLQHKVETLKRYQGGGEQTMPRGVATARGGVWTAGSSRLDLAARRTSLM